MKAARTTGHHTNPPPGLRASVMLEKGPGNYEIVSLDEEKEEAQEESPKRRVLVLHKSTETGDLFVVVAGYFIRESAKFDESVLMEIETVPVTEYARLKSLLRAKLSAPSSTTRTKGRVEKSTPITFW